VADNILLTESENPFGELAFSLGLLSFLKWAQVFPSFTRRYQSVFPFVCHIVMRVYRKEIGSQALALTLTN